MSVLSNMTPKIFNISDVIRTSAVSPDINEKTQHFFPPKDILKSVSSSLHSIRERNCVSIGLHFGVIRVCAG